MTSSQTVILGHWVSDKYFGKLAEFASVSREQLLDFLFFEQLMFWNQFVLGDVDYQFFHLEVFQMDFMVGIEVLD